MPNPVSNRVISDYLSQQGYRPTTDKDGDIMFLKEGARYYIITYEDDPQYYSLARANFFQVNDDAMRLRVITAFNEVNRTTKVAKLSINHGNNHVWATAEQLFGSPEHFTLVLERSISTVDTATRKFIRAINPPPAGMETTPVAAPGTAITPPVVSP